MGLMVDFAEALLRGEDGAEEVPLTAKLIRKRKLLTADSEIEISKKDYSQHQKDTSNIIKKVHPSLPHKPPLQCSKSTILTLALATIFTPSCIIDDIT